MKMITDVDKGSNLLTCLNNSFISLSIVFRRQVIYQCNGTQCTVLKLEEITVQKYELPYHLRISGTLLICEHL
jgi:hypothetical protein